MERVLSSDAEVSRPALRMTGGQAVVRCLRVQGVDLVFGLPGAQVDWLFDALAQERGALRVVHPRHEQALSYMADGYARTTGRIGTLITVPGAGLLNAMTGLATAYACSTPVLCLAGQIPCDFIGRGHGLLHELRDQPGILRSVTKWAARADRVEAIPDVMGEAFRALQTGHVGPVAVELPLDVLQTVADVTVRERVVVTSAEPDPEAIDRAARLLGAAAQPIIFVGGGVLRAGGWEPLLPLAEMLQAPVVMSRNGLGALSDRHYLAHTMVVAEHLLPPSDVILVTGTRFLLPVMSTWGPRADQQVIQLDIDREEVGRNRPASVGIVADARRGLEALANRVPRYNRGRAVRRDELLEVKYRVRQRLMDLQPQAAFAMAIREELPDDGIFVSESTQVGYWAQFGGFPVYRPRTFITSGYQGALGYGYPTALGAQIGAPDRKVVSVNGDGGFMYNAQELATAVRHQINVVAIVFTDNAFGNVRRIQHEVFEGRFVASDLCNPDFVKFAESFGIDGMRANNPGQLRMALREALRRDRPVVIEVPVGEMPNPWPVLRAGFKGLPGIV